MTDPVTGDDLGAGTLARTIAIALDRFATWTDPRLLTADEWVRLGEAAGILHRFHNVQHEFTPPEGT